MKHSVYLQETKKTVCNSFPPREHDLFEVVDEEYEKRLECLNDDSTKKGK